MDQWNCLVSRLNGKSLKISEKLVYAGNDAQIKARKEMKDTFKPVLREVRICAICESFVV